MAENKKLNTFAQLDAQASSTEKVESPTMIRDKPLDPKQAEISIENFSDKAVGDSVKYERPDLNGQEDVIERFQVFAVNPEKDELVKSKNGASSYWKNQVILTYASKNREGLENREYLSGARSFEQKNGSPSDVSFWYEGATKQSQTAMLWELVAKKLNIEPKNMSPRQFIAFMNSKPKVMIAAIKYDNYNAPKGAPAQVSKNMPGQFL